MDRKKLRLVLVIDVLTDIQGGAERQVYEFLKRLDRGQWEVTLFVIHQDFLPSVIKALCPNAYSLGITRIYDWKGLVEGVKFARFLYHNKIDVVMTYHFSSDVWGTFFAELAGIKWIISNRRDDGFWKKAIHKFAYMIMNKLVHKIFVVSQAVKEKVVKDEGVNPEMIEVVSNGVDVTRFDHLPSRELRGALSIPEDEKIVGCVANLHPIKGHRFLLQACQLVQKQNQSIHLVLIGDGGMRNELEEYAHTLGIGKMVHFLGKRADVPALLKEVDICVLPSLSEGMSNTLLEYMAAGKPIVATRVGGNPEVITQGETGVLVPAGSAEALAAGILRILTDQVFAEKLSVQARQQAKSKFSVEVQIRKVQEKVQEISGWTRLSRTVSMGKKPLNVLHLVSSTGLFGAEKVMLELGRHMNGKGETSWIGALENTRNPHREIIAAAQAENIPVFTVEARGKLDYRVPGVVASFIKKKRIDIMHCHNYKANFYGILAARRCHIPVIATNHLWTNTDAKLRLYECIDAQILRYGAHCVVAVSEAIKTDMVKAGVPKDKIVVIPNGMRMPECTKKEDMLREEFSLPRDTVIALVAARLHPEKGHRYLFQALQLMKARGVSLITIIAGEGPLKNELVRLARDLGIQDQIIFTGYRNDMDFIYPGVDIVIQPSLREGVPITLLEAMGYRKAIVATNVGGVSELIHEGKTGLVIEPRSPQALATAIEKLIESRDLRIQLGECAYEFAAVNFSAEKMVARYREVYQKVTESRAWGRGAMDVRNSHTIV